MKRLAWITLLAKTTQANPVRKSSLQQQPGGLSQGHLLEFTVGCRLDERKDIDEQ